MSNLTDKQKVIYKWILANPGYLKKSAENLNVSGGIKDKRVALTAARTKDRAKSSNTKLALSDIIKKKNKAFNKLSPLDKRIAIAKDVILSINSGMLIPNKGAYLKVDSGCQEDRTAQEALCDLDDPIICRCCGIGGIFVSKVKIGNKFEGSINYSSDTEMINNLKGIFSEKQLRLIETAFEGNNISNYSSGGSILTKEEIQKAELFFLINGAWASNYTMIAIMRNIIKNKGTFKP